MAVRSPLMAGGTVDGRDLSVPPSGLSFLANQLLWQIHPNRLNLERQIAGDSSKSEVWAGTLSDLGTGSRHPVAVKRFSIASAVDMANVQREIEILSLASHRCHSCARFWGWCLDSAGMVCVVMTRYDQSLASLLRSSEGGRLPLSEVRRFGMQIARAVAELHEQHIVLSDLKPANVLLDDYKHCVLADFGISKLLTSKAPELEGLHGTFNYMSPESFDPETFGKISTKSDAWSFACCIVEMVSGSVPWAGTSMSAICFKVTASREIPDIPSEIPPHVRELLLRCFAFQSEMRPSFKEIFAVFNSDWGLSASKARHIRSVSLESPPAPTSFDATPASEELAKLREEKQAWLLEREAMVARVHSDGVHIGNLQKNIAEHQSVNQVLQEQLKLMVKGMQHQQDEQRKQRSYSLEGNNHFEVQLAGCQDALNQCMKQKEIAKEMLRTESARTTALTLELKVLQEQRGRMHAVLQALAADAIAAQHDAAWLQAQSLQDHAQQFAYAKHDGLKFQNNGQLSQGKATRDLELERKLANTRPRLDTRLPVSNETMGASHLYDWRTESRTSHESDQGSEDTALGPLDPRDEWMWKMRLNKKRDALSAASTPALSVQSSWDSGSSTARALLGSGREV